VIRDAQNYLALDYGRLVPVLIEAVKEQQQIIGRLEHRMTKLEGTS
jgi:hypothetical protein